MDSDQNTLENPGDSRKANVMMHTIQFGFPSTDSLVSAPNIVTSLKKYGTAAKRQRLLRGVTSARSSAAGSVTQIHLPDATSKLPMLDPVTASFKAPKKMLKSESSSMQFSYTSLSALNKSKPSLRDDPGVSSKVKIPFAALSAEPHEIRSPNDSFSMIQRSRQSTRKDLNKLLENRPLHDKIAQKKAELADKIKETNYSELEGARVYAKCFLSAVRSMEERTEDPETRYLFLKLITLLHNNWQNFLGMAVKTVQGLRDEIKNGILEAKSTKAQHEVERKEWEEKYKKERSKFEIKPIVQQFNLLKEKHHQMKINMERERKELNGQISLLSVNNSKLMSQMEEMKKDTDVIRTTETIRRLNNELHQAQDMLVKEKKDKSSLGFSLHASLESAQTNVKQRDFIIAQKTKEHEDLLLLYTKTKRELDQNKALMKENIEKMHMTCEDILQMELKGARKDGELNEKKAIIAELNKKVEELGLQIKLQREGLVQKKEISMEGTLFYFVWDNPLARMNNQSKYSARKDKLDSSGADGKEKPTEKVAEKNPDTGEVRLDSINMGKYSYLRPTYRALVDDLLPSDDRVKVSYAPPFPVWLHVTIRAIFDSKHNEILLSYNKGKAISRFPEFVYSWLGTFCIDKDSRSIKCLEYTEKEMVAKDNRSNLLLGLEAASAAKLWEITIFKEFLQEELTQDELVYFLHCRFILFKGPQLAVPAAGSCVTHFVTKERVGDTIDKIMYAYGQDERKELKRKLVEFSKQTYKDSNAFDYAMVLRILLEFYRKDKKENFARFEELYTSTKKSLKGSKPMLSFYDFGRITGEYDKGISDQEVCNLYRESFVAGGCSITCDSILLTFSETPFWIRYARLKGQNSEPKYDARGDIDQTDDKGKECAQVYASWEQNEEFFQKVMKQLTECGCAEYLNRFVLMESYIRWKGKEDSAKHSGKSMLQLYRLMWVMILELWSISEEKLQFSTEADCRHDLAKEFGMFAVLKELYSAKIDRVSKFEEKKKSAFAFEQNFAKMTQGTDLLSKIQSKIREEADVVPDSKVSPAKSVKKPAQAIK